MDKRKKKERTEPHNPTWLAIVVAVFVAMPAIVAPYGAWYGYTPDLHMSAYLQVLGCLVAVVLFVQRVSTRKHVLLFDDLFIVLSLFVTWGWLSLWWAHNLYEGGVKLFDWLAALLGAFLVVQVIRTPRHVRLFVEALFWSGVALALLGIVQYLFHVRWIGQTVPPAATFVNKNVAAQYYVLTFPLGAALYWRNDKRLLRWIYAFGTALIVIAILYTRTRAAWLSFLVVLVVLCGFGVYEIAKSRNPFANKRAHGAITAALVFILIAGHFNAKGFHWFFSNVVEIASRTAQQVRFDGTGLQRINIWANTMAMFADNPVLGVGLGNWHVEYPFYHARVLIDHEMGYDRQHINAHNDYLEIVAELGLTGLIFVAWLAWALFRKFRVLLAHANGDHRVIRACLFAAVVGIACDAVWSFPMQQPVSVFLTLVYMCLFSSLGRGTPEPAGWWRVPSVKVQVNRSWIGYGLSAVFAAWFVVMLAVNVRLYQSERYLRIAKIELIREAYQPMVLAGMQAYILNPYRDRLLGYVALGYYKNGDYRKAIEYFERVLASYPYLLSILYNANVSYLHAGHPDEALKKLQILESIRPHDYKVTAGVASLLDMLGREEEAMTYMEKAIAVAPEGERAGLQALYDRKKRDLCAAGAC